MGKKLHAAPEVQMLVNAVMPWAAARLKADGGFPPVAAWLPSAAGEARLGSPAMLDSACSSQAAELRLADDLRQRWQAEMLQAAALVAPVFYGKADSAERSTAVRLHVETRSGYSADILMPYRIRPAWSWRGLKSNRVHFSHPVAQESDLVFSRPDDRPSAPAGE